MSGAGDRVRADPGRGCALGMMDGSRAVAGVPIGAVFAVIVV